MQKNSSHYVKRDKQFKTFMNEAIKAPNIMIVTEERENLGVFNRRRALEMAEEKWLDLVQINYDSSIMQCTALMVDYGKYMYKKQKNEKEKKKNQKNKWLKELKMGYSIGDNDLQLKIKKATAFLGDGYNVKMVIRLRGREHIYTWRAIEKLQWVQESLSSISRPQYAEPKKEAWWYAILLFAK